jgi:hypothetical protein
MKILICTFLLFFIIQNFLYSIDLKISGETNYHQSEYQSLNTKLNFEYKINLYEHPNKIYKIYLGNVISNDYDHFGKIFKINNFTTIKFEF